MYNLVDDSIIASINTAIAITSHKRAMSTPALPPELAGLDFAALKARLLSMWIPTIRCATVNDLAAAWHRCKDVDRSAMPLREVRKDWKEPGLRACAADGCLRSEDGFRAFDMCSRCKSAFYCGRECQARDWKSRHKRDCTPAPVSAPVPAPAAAAAAKVRN